MVIRKKALPTNPFKRFVKQRDIILKHQYRKAKKTLNDATNQQSKIEISSINKINSLKTVSISLDDAPLVKIPSNYSSKTFNPSDNKRYKFNQKSLSQQNSNFSELKHSNPKKHKHLLQNSIPLSNEKISKKHIFTEKEKNKLKDNLFQEKQKEPPNASNGKIKKADNIELAKSYSEEIIHTLNPQSSFKKSSEIVINNVEPSNKNFTKNLNSTNSTHIKSRYSKSLKKALEKKQQWELEALERQKKKEEILQRRIKGKIKRRQEKNILLKRTRKGQPILSSTVQHLLNKFSSKK